MTKILSRFGHGLACIGIAALLSPACSADGAEPVPEAQAAPDLGLSSESLVIGVWITETHWIGFYEIEDDKVMVLERHDMDRDVALLADQRIEPGQYAPFYRRIAGQAADATALARLEVLDAKMRSLEATGSDEPNAHDADETHLNESPADRLVEKDFTSDMTWFSNTFCNGCMGLNGTRIGWEWGPVCTTTPEVCSATWQTGTLRRRSKNVHSVVGNFGFSPGRYGVYINDGCENSNWWQRTFVRDCYFWGKREHLLDVPARTSVWATVNAGQSWTRNYVVEGPAEMAIKIDTW